MATPGSRPFPGGSRDILWRVLGWRIVSSIVWSVLLLPICTTVFIIFSSIDLFHPIQWLSDCFNDLYSSYVIFYLLLLSAVIVIINIFNVEFYAVITKGRYSFLVVPCTDSESLDSPAAQSCLNEHHLFSLLAGAFMGYSYSLQYFINNMNYLPFPIIQQYKFLRFRRSLLLLVKHSCVESLFLVRNFCILYYFLGYIPKAWIGTAMDLREDRQLNPLDTVSGLLNLSLLYHVWLCGVFVLTTWYISWILFKIYVTEAHLFPVQPPFAEESDECLPKVLNSNPPLIIKYLALQDLMLLSQYSPSRRQEVFSLSQPGGHPHNWTAISRECLNLINDMTQKLVVYQEAAAINGRVGSSYPVEPKILNCPEEITFQTPKSSQVTQPSVPPLVKTSLFSSKLSTPDAVSPLRAPFASGVMNRVTGILDVNTCCGSHQSPQLRRREPRLWSSASDQQMTEFSNPSPSTYVGSEGKIVGQPNVIYSWIQNKREQIKNFLSKRVLIMYLFSKHPEASIQAVFSDAQLHIWALEGLSHLVAASFTEDRFGVVQTTLPAILNALLTLQEAVDKYFKLPHASSKPPRISESLVDTSYKTLRFAFRASLKTAIYRITTTFGEHLNAVQASAEHQKRLQQFLEFKE
ncbi:PREDICTED: nucleoporin NDC1 isoform X2 [Elephantulus edwardii]|uniref:nucleoporin NDC1 isoform X2 n=1 Tax=Elephantulus edwardii TaxID=28737 RepID=UPI0003F09CA0|nr:PREDICTED: nucleoporin NDC1 isoform X2 [Elephantulus edwardii]